MGDWGLGAGFSLIIAWIAWRKRSLIMSGMLAAIFVGTILFGLGSLSWYGTMLCFFISSTLLSKWKRHVKAEAEATYEKSGHRDAGQVFANGGAAVLLCVLYAWLPADAWFYLFVGVMAAVTADTWATEVGGLSRSRPVFILTGKPVDPGTSGGITWLGTGASAAGGAFIGGAVALFLWLESGIFPALVIRDYPLPFGAWILLGLISGLFGSLVDSLIGARWQRMNRCEGCGRRMEKRQHCGKPTLYDSGVAWLNNDWVNAISSLAGGAVALLIVKLIG